jgi:hypothetical protein
VATHINLLKIIIIIDIGPCWCLPYRGEYSTEFTCTLTSYEADEAGSAGWASAQSVPKSAGGSMHLSIVFNSVEKQHFTGQRPHRAIIRRLVLLLFMAHGNSEAYKYKRYIHQSMQKYCCIIGQMNSMHVQNTYIYITSNWKARRVWSHALSLCVLHM